MKVSIVAIGIPDSLVYAGSKVQAKSAIRNLLFLDWKLSSGPVRCLMTQTGHPGEGCWIYPPRSAKVL